MIWGNLFSVRRKNFFSKGKKILLTPVLVAKKSPETQSTLYFSWAKVFLFKIPPPKEKIICLPAGDKINFAFFPALRKKLFLKKRNFRKTIFVSDSPTKKKKGIFFPGRGKFSPFLFARKKLISPLGEKKSKFLLIIVLKNKKIHHVFFAAKTEFWFFSSRGGIIFFFF